MPKKANQLQPKAVKSTQRRSGQSIVQRTVEAPVARGSIVRAATKPQMSTSPNGVLVRHREFIGPVVGLNLPLSVQSYPIIPSNNFLFPWLSAMAGSYEFYRFRRLTFHYIGGCPTTIYGSTGFFVDSDIIDVYSNATALNQIMQNVGATLSPAWSNASTTVTRDILTAYPRFYTNPVLTGSIPTLSTLNSGLRIGAKD